MPITNQPYRIQLSTGHKPIGNLFLCALMMALALHTTAQEDKVADGYTLQYNTNFNALINDEGIGIFQNENAWHLKIDDRGFIWLITPAGLVRFDGKNLNSFMDSTTKAFCKLFFDDDEIIDSYHGQVYAAGANQLWQYLPAKGSAFKLIKQFNDSLIIKSIRVADGGQFWITFDNQPGLWLLQGNQLQNVGNLKDKSMRLQRARHGLLYAFTDTGYYVFKSGKLINYIAIGKALHIADNFAEEDDIWGFDKKKLYKLGINGTRDSLPLPDYNSTQPTRIFIYKKKQLDVFYFFIRQGSNRNLFKMFKLGKNTCDEIISAIILCDCAEDGSGNLWLFNKKGLCRLLKTPFYKVAGSFNLLHFGIDGIGKNIVVKADTVLPRYLQNKGVTKQWTARNGDRWFYTPKGLYLLASNMHQYTFYEGKPNIIGEDTAGTIWFRNEVPGSINFLRHRKFIDFDGYNRDRDGFIVDFLYNKNIYCIFSKKVAVFDGKNFKRLFDKGNFNHFSNFCTDANNNVWIVLNDKLYKMGMLANGKMGLSDSVALAHANNIKFMAFDHHNNLWATGAYIPCATYIFLWGADGKLTTSRITLPPAFSLDNAQPLPSAGNLMYFVKSMGSNNDEVLAINTDSTIDAYTKNAAMLHGPYLTDILILDQPYHGFPTTAYDSFGMPIRPTFNYQQNRIAFKCSAISPSFPATIVYQYRLQGLEDDWRAATANNGMEYNNLAPGQYTLWVRAQDFRKQWTVPIAYAFYILPPWYQAWWAYILWCCLLAGLAALLFSLRLRALRKNDNMERMLTEQQLKALRAQIDPHFLQNSFELIGRRIQLANVQGTLEALEKVSAYIRKVLYRTDKSTATLEEELEFINEYLAVQQALMDNSFAYNIQIDADVDVFGHDVPSLVLQPIVENAIKHGIDHRLKVGYISITVLQNGSFIYCHITDSGTGLETFEKEKCYRPKGLENTMQRLMLLYRKEKNKPSVAIVANAKGGHTVTVALPLTLKP